MSWYVVEGRGERVEWVWFASLGLAEPYSRGAGLVVPLTCGCAWSYAGGARRSLLTICWDHECEFHMGQSLRVAAATSINLRN